MISPPVGRAISPAAQLAAALVTPLVACASPPVVVHTDRCTVRAPTRTEAERVALLAQELRLAVEDAVPGTTGETVEIRVQEDYDGHAAIGVRSGGRTTTRWARVPGLGTFELGRRIELPVGAGRGTLAHELVHALLDGSWDRLPPYLEEGLADCLADRLDPGHAAERRATALTLAMHGAQLRLPVRRGGPEGQPLYSFGLVSRLPTLERIHAGAQGDCADDLWWPACYAYGWLVATRVVARAGFPGLHELVLDAGSSGAGPPGLPAVLAAAGVPAEGGLEDLLRRELGEEDLRGIVAASFPRPGAPPGYLVSLLRERHPGADEAELRARVRAADPWVIYGSLGVSLASLPGWEEAVERALRPRTELDEEGRSPFVER